MLEPLGSRCRRRAARAPCGTPPTPLERRTTPEATAQMTRDNVTLDDLRQRVTDIDRQMIALVAERKAVSEEVARVKRATGKPTRDYERERDVIMGVRAMATERGVSPGLAEQMLRLLIRSSLTTQEQASVVAHGAGTGRRALVIGGAGKMGGWFVSFLASQGFAVEVADTGRGPARGDAPGGLAHHRPQARLHRARHPARGDRCDPARPRAAPPAGGDLRRRLAQVAAALGTHGAEVPRLQGDLRAPDVRPGHRAAVRPPRGVRGPGARGGAGQCARAVRAHHGRAGGDEPRRPRPADRLRAGAFAMR